MEPILRENFFIPHGAVDRFNRIKPSWLLALAQEVAGEHFDYLNADMIPLEQKNLFWAVIRHRVQISRLPGPGETITLETWPMPTTRVAYPRSTVAYDEKDQEVFRSISLWVLMDKDSRSMILPGKSGVNVQGLLRGSELAVPGSLAPKPLANHSSRTVAYTDLDCNGHVNNTRYLDWIDDLLPSAFHQDHPVREFTICYLSEGREAEQLDLNWEIQDGPILRLDAHRETTATNGHERVFSAHVLFE